MQRIHQLEGDREELLLDLDEIARAGARKMLAQAQEAEVQDYLQAAKAVSTKSITRSWVGRSV